MFYVLDISELIHLAPGAHVVDIISILISIESRGAEKVPNLSQLVTDGIQANVEVRNEFSMVTAFQWSLNFNGHDLDLNLLDKPSRENLIKGFPICCCVIWVSEGADLLTLERKSFNLNIQEHNSREGK